MKFFKQNIMENVFINLLAYKNITKKYWHIFLGWYTYPTWITRKRRVHIYFQVQRDLLAEKNPWRTYGSASLSFIPKVK